MYTCKRALIKVYMGKLFENDEKKKKIKNTLSKKILLRCYKRMLSKSETVYVFKLL